MFLYIRSNYSYTLYIDKDTVLDGSDVEKQIFNCHSKGTTIVDARTSSRCPSDISWEDSFNDFHRFRIKGVYVSTSRMGTKV